MTFRMRIKLEAYHKPTEKWHVYSVKQNVRALSRKHAIDKGLKVLQGWPGYQDRQDQPDWIVGGEAAILDGDEDFAVVCP